ncbi:hypothetical protein [Frankia sp. Cas4]|nr:hypothetical protein [Frankia sp. Cas4]
MWLLAALGQPAVEGEVDGVQRDPNEGAHPGRLATPIGYDDAAGPPRPR